MADKMAARMVDLRADTMVVLRAGLSECLRAEQKAVDLAACWAEHWEPVLADYLDDLTVASLVALLVDVWAAQKVVQMERHWVALKVV